MQKSRALRAKLEGRLVTKLKILKRRKLRTRLKILRKRSEARLKISVRMVRSKLEILKKRLRQETT